MARRKPEVEQQQTGSVKCAHDICPDPAVCKIKTLQGWANLCMKHYELHFKLRAEQTCQRLGLLTTDMKRQWVREAAKKLEEKWRVGYEREPGEDAQEAA